jgi:hypothetical protein
MNTATTTRQKNRISSHVPAAPLLSEPTKERMRKARAQRESKQAAGPNPAEVELLVQQWEAKKAAAKELYSAADELESQLLQAIGVGGSIQMSDNRIVRVVDNFIDANGNVKAKHFGLAGVRRFELKCK